MPYEWSDEDRLRDDAKGHEQLLRRVNAAIAKLEADRAEAGKASASGWPVYSADERQQREAEGLQAFTAAIDEEEASLTEAIAKFEGEQVNLQRSQDNPLSRLSTEDLTRASALRGFVESDVQRLSGPDLVAEVEQIVATGDRGVMAAWHHVLLTRADQLDGDARTLHVAVVEKLNEHLRDPAIDKKLKASAKRLEQAKAARQTLWATVRPLRMANMRAELVASGGYAPL